jgi:D-glycero-D-manno-heptose 1,7-bisphosphate phosphatase
VLVVLDRDGVINEDRSDFVKSPSELVFIDGALRAISRLNALKHHVVIATNQSCIGRGIISEDTLTQIHGKLHQELNRIGGRIDEIFFAPDPPWAATDMRKPGAGMILSAMQKFRKSASQTIFIGDALRDMQAAKSAGCHRLLVQTGKGQRTQADEALASLLPVSVAADLTEAVSFIESGRFQ